MSGCYPRDYKCKCGCHDSFQIRCGCDCHFKDKTNVSPMVEHIQKLEEKIKELESSKACADIVDQEYTKIINRIEKIERLEKVLIEYNGIIDAMEIDFEYAIDDLRDRMSDVENIIKKNKTSHKCPVCEGSGNLFLPPFKDDG